MEKTLNQLMKEFEIIATEHRQINSFFQGDYLDAVSRDAVDYPLMVVTLQPGQISDFGVQVNAIISIADKYNIQEYRQINEIHSDCLSICKDIHVILKQWRFEDFLDVEGTMATTPFINRSHDVTAGWTMNIAMNVFDAEDWCQIPMGNVMYDTVKQLFNLVWFCKKVSIPFEVYAFTNDYPLVSYDESGKSNLRELAYQKKDGLIQVGEWFSLLNLLTSKTNGNTLEKQMKNIWRLACSFCTRYSVRYNIPHGLSLSGTPLNESLIALHQILPKFQKENKLQKVQCVILTDGESCMIKYHREVKRHWEENPFLGTSHIPNGAFLRDRKTGNTYSLDVEWHEMTDVFLRDLRDKFPDINFIGIRVLESRDAGNFIRRYYGWYGDGYEKTMSAWKKEKAFSIKKSGYHTYFGLSASALSQDTEFEVSEDASKAQIKNAFMKSLKSKKMNKRILGEFIELVA